MTIKLNIRPKLPFGMPLEEWTEVTFEGDSEAALANIFHAQLREAVWTAVEAPVLEWEDDDEEA